METLNLKKTNGLTSEKTEWDKAQRWELEWQNNQQFNDYNEQTKQYVYSHYLGLDVYKTNYHGIIGWDFGDKSILDIGGGGQSILLKSKARRRVVVDPLNYSDWIRLRYKEAGIIFLNTKGEDIDFNVPFDEIIIYNVLQHVFLPDQIIEKSKQQSKIIRIFEWIDTSVSEGHPHILTEEKLNEWLGGYGKVGYLNESPTVGKFYSGIFKGDHYDE